VAIEGPYGTFTRATSHRDKVLLVGAGVGVTPIRAMLEDLDPGVNVVLINRASSEEQLIFKDEIRSLMTSHRGRLHELVGPRRLHPLDWRQLRKLVPDVAERDVFVCGPEGLADRVAAAAAHLGVAPERIHREEFAF
jgi:ferredoxin-NADP reductase